MLLHLLRAFWTRVNSSRHADAFATSSPDGRSEVLDDEWVLQEHGIEAPTELTAIRASKDDEYLQEKGWKFLTEGATFLGVHARSSGWRQEWWTTRPSEFLGQGKIVRLSKESDSQTRFVERYADASDTYTLRRQKEITMTDTLEVLHGRYRYVGHGKLECSWESRAVDWSSAKMHEVVAAAKDNSWMVGELLQRTSNLSLDSLNEDPEPTKISDVLSTLPASFWENSPEGFRQAAEKRLEMAVAGENATELEEAMHMATMACLQSTFRNDSRDQLLALARHKLEAGAGAPKRRFFFMVPPREAKPSAEDVAELKKKAADKVHELTSALKSSPEKSKQLVPCLKALRTYISNVADHPSEEKYRSIKLNGKAFSERVAPFPEALALLELCGFAKEDEQLAFQTSTQRALLWAAKQYLDVSLSQAS